VTCVERWEPGTKIEVIKYGITAQIFDDPMLKGLQVNVESFKKVGKKYFYCISKA
jgi:hypothetical protein